jgi:hypothetical protein
MPDQRKWLVTDAMRHVLKQLEAQRHLLIDTLVLGIAGAWGTQLFMGLLHEAEWVFLHWFAAYQVPGLPSEGGPRRGRGGACVLPAGWGGFAVACRMIPRSRGKSRNSSNKEKPPSPQDHQVRKDQQ